MFSVWFLLLCTTNILGSNILYVSPVPSPSHHLWNRVFALELTNRGYNVTFFGPDKDKTKLQNYTHILIDHLYDTFSEHFDLSTTSTTATQALTQFVDWCILCCTAYLNSKGLQVLLNYPHDFKFDLIIFDVSMGSCLYPLLHRFKYPPAIAVTPFLLPPFVAYNFGNLLNPSYSPWYNLPYTQQMTFMERIWNVLHTYSEIALRNNKLFHIEHEQVKTVFGEVPPMDVLERHFSLLLTNIDPVLHGAQPLAPNVISVGGLQTQKPEKIPEDLLSIVDGAKNGVIVFSLGTNIRSDKLDERVRKVLLDAFSTIPQIVIWKFETDINNLPRNVIVRKWMPQSALLAHPNVKLFIGHGGALSTQEAMYHGVPMVCIPFMLDQYFNAQNMVSRKLGILLKFQLITKNYVLEKLREILENPIYLENVRKISKQFRDRQTTPLERAVFWTEYVMRHGGTNMSTATRDLTFFTSAGLDFGLLIIVLTTGIVAACSVVILKLTAIRM